LPADSEGCGHVVLGQACSLALGKERGADVRSLVLEIVAGRAIRLGCRLPDPPPAGVDGVCHGHAQVPGRIWVRRPLWPGRQVCLRVRGFIWRMPVSWMCWKVRPWESSGFRSKM